MALWLEKKRENSDYDVSAWSHQKVDKLVLKAW